MRITYQQPDVQVIDLSLRSGILIGGSNEGYSVDPYNPGFAPQPNTL